MTYFLLIFFSLSAFAGSPTYLLKRDRASLTFDFNKDKKADYLEKFEDGKLIETQYDIDGDGRMDQLTTLDPKAEFFKIVEISHTKKSPRKRISYSNNELTKKTIAFTQIDTNNDGIWDHSYQNETSIDQEYDNCSGPMISPVTETLASDVQSASLLTDDYIRTNYGYRIHQSCTGTDKKWFEPALRESITTGLQCLRRLSQEGMRGAARNLSALESLLSTNNVQILCNENDYRWNPYGVLVFAHATGGPHNAQRMLPLVHPGISFNPSSIVTDSIMSNNEVALLNIKRTAFHEQLHNLGHLHGVDPEVSYTCQECCFPTADATAEATNAACVVCGGDYASITDPDYLRDITAFPDSHGITRGPLSPILANLRENPTDKLGMANLALLNAGIHGAVGVELGNILSARPDLTPEVREVVDRALTYNSSSTLDPYRPGGRIIAQALVIYYLDQDPLAALAHIRANENLIKDQFALGVSRNDGYVLRNMRQNLNTLLQEAMGRYQRGDTKDSYALSNEGNRLTRLLGL